MSLSSLGLDAFYAISKFGTVIQAASQIGLTQTAVTQRIRSLEREMGASLFIRTKKGMKLTPDGLALLGYCQQRIDLEAKLLDQIKAINLGSDVQVQFCGPTYLIEDRVVAILDKIKSAYPKLTIQLNVNHSSDLLTKVLRGETEFAIIPSMSTGIDVEFKRLRPTQYYLVGSSYWIGRNLTEILQVEKEVVYSADDQFIERLFTKKPFSTHKRKRERMIVDNEFLVAQAVCKGMGYMMLDMRHAQPLIQKGYLINLLPDTEIEIFWDLIWAKRSFMSNYLKDIVALIN